MYCFRISWDFAKILIRALGQYFSILRRSLEIFFEVQKKMDIEEKSSGITKVIIPKLTVI